MLPEIEKNFLHLIFFQNNQTFVLIFEVSFITLSAPYCFIFICVLDIFINLRYLLWKMFTCFSKSLTYFLQIFKSIWYLIIYPFISDDTIWDFCICQRENSALNKRFKHNEKEIKNILILNVSMKRRVILFWSFLDHRVKKKTLLRGDYCWPLNFFCFHFR